MLEWAYPPLKDVIATEKFPYNDTAYPENDLNNNFFPSFKYFFFLLNPNVAIALLVKFANVDTSSVVDTHMKRFYIR